MSYSPFLISPDMLRTKLNACGKAGLPCFFIIDFLLEQCYFLEKAQLKNDVLYFSFPKASNHHWQNLYTAPLTESVLFAIKPPALADYIVDFNKAQQVFIAGQSFLLNLTYAIPVKSRLSLQQIFYTAKAKYRVYLKNQFVCFSPEIFIKINELGEIISYPMKGTIKATLPKAKQRLYNDEKELAEHYTIVDLIRNDLNQVARNVKVTQFRYFEKIKTEDGALWQTSSKIVGQLPSDFQKNLGDILLKLLPAGSISGAPKNSTVAAIKRIEHHKRSFYTGIAAYFDGQCLDSCVLIRFIEQRPNGLLYKTGGGLTIYSKALSEYQELLQKIYVPTY